MVDIENLSTDCVTASNLPSKLKLDENNNKTQSQISDYTNEFLNKINKNLEKFNYNVIIANIYEFYNFFSQELNKSIENEILVDS